MPLPIGRTRPRRSEDGLGRGQVADRPRNFRIFRLFDLSQRIKPIPELVAGEEKPKGEKKQKQYGGDNESEKVSGPADNSLAALAPESPAKHIAPTGQIRDERQKERRHKGSRDSQQNCPGHRVMPPLEEQTSRNGKKDQHQRKAAETEPLPDQKIGPFIT